MRVAIYRPDDAPYSFHVCCDNIAKLLPDQGITPVIFTDAINIPDAELIWDPNLGGGIPPNPAFVASGRPLFLTVHGVSAFDATARPGWSLSEHYWRFLDLRSRRRAWARLPKSDLHVVTVSQFSKKGIVKHLRLTEDQISVVPNGVDHALFKPDEAISASPSFLHVSNGDSRKNLRRILAAYGRLDPASRWPLVLKLPRRIEAPLPPDVRTIDTRLDDAVLSELYRKAGAFVFPTLYEGFGLPVLEAMASGVPVVTSQNSACSEVAAGAALEVPPTSTKAIADAMQSLMEDSALRSRLRQAGLARAQTFSWQAAAAGYATLFRRAV